MEIRANSSPPARSSRGRSLSARPSPVAIMHLAVWATLLLLLGCGSAGHGDPASSSLVVGRRAAPIPPVQLAVAAKVAHRFAKAYAEVAYLRRPPKLPDASPAVDRHIAASARRVPSSRRGLHPHAADFRLNLSDASHVKASVEVHDDHFAPFSVGFALERRPIGWIVVSISTPE
jgi:hypothetical protein